MAETLSGTAPAPDRAHTGAALKGPQAEAEREFVRGVEFHRAEQTEQALKHYGRAVALDPRHPMAWNNMGVILRRQGKRAAALACYRRAIALKPEEPSHHANLGNVLRDLGRFEEAERHAAKAVALEPGNAGAWHNYGLILQDLGRHDEALVNIEKAIGLDPANVSFRWDRALNLLMKGDLAAGFAEYEVRWKLPHNPPPRIVAPEWTGDSLEGRTILIWAEQGFGDSLQFIRYAPLVKARGAKRIILLAQAPLARLMGTAAGIDAVVTEGAPMPNFDCHAPLLSLPRLFGTTLDKVPAEIPYLKVPPGSGRMIERPAGTKLAVGICWAGKPSHKNDRNRSAGIEPFLRLLSHPAIAFYSLQKGPRAADLTVSGAGALVHDLSAAIEDFGDTARFVRQLDLVITVDTAVAHLAGALGVPVWVALPATIDWRWMRGRADSPWYPSMRLFRQKQPGAWEPVFAEIDEALKALLTEDQRSTAEPIRPARTAQQPASEPMRLPQRSAAPQGRAHASVNDEEREILLPSVFRRPDGEPRFVMPIPRRFIKDAGIGYLARHEAQFGGYEYPTRLFLDQHLQPGDVFIDVGAHWGLYALTAATRWPGEITVLAIEPEPENLKHLQFWLRRNGMERDVTVIPAGAGAAQGTARFARNSTMGHGIADPGAETPFGTFEAPIVTIDGILSQRPQLAGRRLFLKIDVEGHEPAVLDGARALLESGRVEAVIWERGRNYDHEPHRGRLERMMAELARLGYAHHRFPHETLGGPLLPYVFNHELINVFSLGANFLRRTSYARPPGPIPQPPRPSSVALAPEQRGLWTRALMAAKSSDGGRWADDRNLEGGAEERARHAAPHVPEGSRVLDLGAGLMRIRDLLPADSLYVPADLVSRAEESIVVDLNAGDFPPGSYDAVLMLEVLEYLHDPHAVLARARGASQRLILTYRVHEGGEAADRRAAGIFNDLTRTDIEDILAATDWKPTGIEEGEGYVLYLCRASSGAARISASDARASRGWVGRLGLGRR